MRPLKPLALALFMTALSAVAGSAEPSLVIVEQHGCVYCERWNAEIAPAYPKTAEGKFAPLVRADLREGPPDGVTYTRRVVFTPTFVLIENGQEQARIEGYPGEDFFWPLLTQMLTENTEFAPGAASDAIRK